MQNQNEVNGNFQIESKSEMKEKTFQFAGEVIDIKVPEIEIKITGWDYDISIEKVKGLKDVYDNTRNQMIGELYKAHTILTNRGARVDLKPEQTWENYLASIGMAKSTANRWLRLYDPNTGKVGKTKNKVSLKTVSNQFAKLTSEDKTAFCNRYGLISPTEFLDKKYVQDNFDIDLQQIENDKWSEVCCELTQSIQDKFVDEINEEISNYFENFKM